MAIERWDGQRFVPQLVTRWSGTEGLEQSVVRHNAIAGSTGPTSPPSAPRSLSVTRTDTTATLRWEPPLSGGGGPIVKYEVSRTGAAAVMLDATATQFAREYTFTGLPAGTYELTVSALNSAFEGPAASASVTIAAAPPPEGGLRSIRSIPYGIYRSASAGVTKLNLVADWVGRPFDLAMDFQASDTASNLSWPNWQYNAWAPGTPMLIGTTLTPIVGNNAHADWSAAANGSMDTIWRNMGLSLVARGHANARLRGNHEFNGGWFGHRVQPGEEANFIKAWRRWVDILRAVPGQRFSFDWNPTHGNQWLYSPETAWPGKDWVSSVALDVYDDYYNRGWLFGGTGTQAPPTEAEQQEVWNSILNGRRGLKFWSAFAAAQGLPMSLPEWGIRIWKESDGLIHGGGDNVIFVDGMYSFITDAANNILYHAPWEDPGQGFFSAPVPRASARYAELFHGPRVDGYVGLA